ncbi:MAG: hypothetical protein GTN38_02110 [Candidatus Aenigmarchaeota archaeon]|nr:hypothetical protein [Candidatus Aenigmarchaeota archaeon]NIP40349.1 hypothetical protein [Candidatus Aenigmarchaeota archaeon]NIS73224.1 hypothetical protein [Candidatus Aenigmarchaeota archaeon]
MVRKSCHGCDSRKVKLSLCVKSEKHTCRDCCVKDIKMIGKCTYWPVCW